MSNIKLFESKKIRSVWNDEEQKWYFSVADVVEVLTDTPNPADYIKKIRKRDVALSEGWGQIVTPLEMTAADGKKRKIQSANIEGLKSIIQFILSPKAELFKRWLVRVGGNCHPPNIWDSQRKAKKVKKNFHNFQRVSSCTKY